MNVSKRIALLSLLVAIFSLLPANATLVGIGALHESSLTDEEGNTWSGSSVYDADGLFALVEYSVYDTLGGNEFETDGGFTNPGQGQYVYAYEVFNHPTLSTKAISAFSLLDIVGVDIDASLMDGATAIDGGDGGEEPVSLEPTDATWKWDFFTGYIQGGERSWLLVFSSNASPVEGSYTFETPPINDNIAVVPEPCTILLLTMGATLLINRKKRTL